MPMLLFTVYYIIYNLTTNFVNLLQVFKPCPKFIPHVLVRVFFWKKDKTNLIILSIVRRGGLPKCLLLRRVRFGGKPVLSDSPTERGGFEPPIPARA
jgi:hypothetical protein